MYNSRHRGHTEAKEYIQKSMGYTWGSLLFLVRGSPPGAENSDDHDHHDGDDADGNDDDQQHVTV